MISSYFAKQLQGMSQEHLCKNSHVELAISLTGLPITIYHV